MLIGERSPARKASWELIALVWTVMNAFVEGRRLAVVVYRRPHRAVWLYAKSSHSRVGAVLFAVSEHRSCILKSRNRDVNSEFRKDRPP